jgi:hypothetical protein
MIPKPSLLMIDDGCVKFLNETISKDQADSLREYYSDIKSIEDKVINSISLDSVMMSDESFSLMLKGVLAQ